jgi:hypothetical protein
MNTTLALGEEGGGIHPPQPIGPQPTFALQELGGQPPMFQPPMFQPPRMVAPPPITPPGWEAGGQPSLNPWNGPPGGFPRNATNALDEDGGGLDRPWFAPRPVRGLIGQWAFPLPPQDE